MRRDPARSRLASAPAVAVKAALLSACLVAASAWGEPVVTDAAASGRARGGDAAPGDRIAQFLGDHGLVPAVSEPALVRQVRERAADWTSDLVLSAMNFLGVRYRRGGESADDGFDCSGFTRHVFEASIGLVLPRRANEQAKSKTLEPVNRDQLKPGDLVFFNTLRTAFSHVGIYVGDGKFIHAPRTGGEVRVEDMRVAYWSKRYNGARRAVAPEGPEAAGPAPATAFVGPPAPAAAVAPMPQSPAADKATAASTTPGVVY